MKKLYFVLIIILVSSFAFANPCEDPRARCKFQNGQRFCAYPGQPWMHCPDMRRGGPPPMYGGPQGYGPQGYYPPHQQPGACFFVIRGINRQECRDGIVAEECMMMCRRDPNLFNCDFQPGRPCRRW